MIRSHTTPPGAAPWLSLLVLVPLACGQPAADDGDQQAAPDGAESHLDANAETVETDGLGAQDAHLAVDAATGGAGRGERCEPSSPCELDTVTGADTDTDTSQRRGGDSQAPRESEEFVHEFTRRDRLLRWKRL